MTLLFLRQDNSILLAMKKRGFGEGRWNGVGGKVEADETIEQAMIRESQEEIGITPTAYEKVADINFNVYYRGEPALLNVHTFFATKWEGKPTESEEMKPKWFNIADIPYDKMWPDDPYWLPVVLKGQKLTADFTLDETDVIISHKLTEVSGFKD